MEAATKNLKPRFDIEKMYKKYKKVLKKAKNGEVITRFPPEPSGYLHIGHIKAALLNFHYSRMFNSKMILRFDDTNPTNEKHEYEEAILEDVKAMGIEYDVLVYTSDHFDLIFEKCTWMIENGHAYCDNTPHEQMKKERMDGIASKCRDVAVEENLRIWGEMQKGELLDYCVRAKISATTKNKCMRDPVMFRHNKDPHPRTGTKYKVYPTYDFACPIIDATDGVTYCMRTNEYADRNKQYAWFLKTMGLRDVKIYDYSRLNFIHTTLSKRKLNWFVQNKLVEGWDDPRFPTFRGIFRRGLLLNTLIEFMLEQGPSKNTNLMEWDKLWALNKKNLNPISRRFTALNVERKAVVTISNAADIDMTTTVVPMHPKNKDAGQKPFYKAGKLIMEPDDAELIEVGEKITLMKWGNFVVESKTVSEEGNFDIVVKATLDDKVFKGTKKLTWLPYKEELLVDVTFVEIGHLLKVRKLDPALSFESQVNYENRFETEAKGEAIIKTLQHGCYVQFERRGFYRLDKITTKNNRANFEFIYIPDGKSKNMSTLKFKIDPKLTALGV
jgi:glutamyl-tRNA synthetase